MNEFSVTLNNTKKMCERDPCFKGSSRRDCIQFRKHIDHPQAKYPRYLSRKTLSKGSVTLRKRPIASTPRKGPATSKPTPPYINRFFKTTPSIFNPSSALSKKINQPKNGQTLRTKITPAADHKSTAKDQIKTSQIQLRKQAPSSNMQRSPAALPECSLPQESEQKHTGTNQPKQQAQEPDLNPLALTTGDQFITSSNLLHWGLIGASFLGAPRSIVYPISVISQWMSSAANGFLIPKNASFLRKLTPLFFSIFVKANPLFERFLKALFFYNLGGYSWEKMNNIWNHYKANPKQAIQSGTVHFFNLASGIASATA